MRIKLAPPYIHYHDPAIEEMPRVRKLITAAHLICLIAPRSHKLAASRRNRGCFTSRRGRGRREKGRGEMATNVVSSSLVLKPSPMATRPQAKGMPSLSRPSSSLKVVASGGKKIKTPTPYGPGGGMNLSKGLDASGRKPKGKGVYQFVDKYGANVDGYSPIYNPEEWSPSGDVYVGGTTGLLIWAVTLFGLLAGGALLVYNTSALAQ